jgi:hypothetical protein
MGWVFYFLINQVIEKWWLEVEEYFNNGGHAYYQQVLPVVLELVAKGFLRSRVGLMMQR